VPDQRDRLQALFGVEHRYNNFGEVLISMHVQGFRCHTSTVVNIESPITAFCGLNGTGKSTLLHLAAVAYKKPGRNRRQSYVRDYIVTGTLDPNPFAPDASVEFGYWQQDRKIKRVDLRRDERRTRWLGYTRRPARPIYYAGIGLYLPKIEIRDFVLRNAAKLTIAEERELPDQSKRWICTVLNWNYEAITNHKVKHGGRTGGVVTVARGGSRYSEANMGCGEGRVQHIIGVLETLPDKSLVLLEEPETSLHPSAQYEFGRYLIDVCIRKKHQVLMTTHSEYLLKALPSRSRIYLDRSTAVIRPIRGITTAQAVSLMSEGHDKALHVLVEDNVALAVLTEIVRRVDATFLRTIAISPSGDARTIQSVMRALREVDIPVIAVRDGDMPVNTEENIFKLPGTLPPEREILNNASVRTHLLTNYQINATDFLAANQDLNHHEWFSHLSVLATINESALIHEVARVYAESLAENEVDTLVNVLKGSIRR
jgi:predicted ATPase